MSAQRYAELFERLTPADIDGFDQVFAPDARFCDPFNDVRSVAAIQRVFRHMFEQCEAPRFEVQEVVERSTVAYFRWHFYFRRDAETYEIEGTSRVEFDDQGRVSSHIDYWDPTRLYDRLPLIGSLTRWLRRRLATP